MQNTLLCLLILFTAVLLFGCDTDSPAVTETKQTAASSTIASSAAVSEVPLPTTNTPAATEVSTDNLRINGYSFHISYENNDTADAFRALLPAVYSMSELNGNEKYIYLDTSLPSSPQKVGYINAGDVMLYGDNCLVIFYDSFDTIYSYTRIGHIDNIEHLKAAAGTGNIQADFS